MYSPAQIRQVRALDGVTYSLTALAFIFYFPDIFRDLPGNPSFFSLLPIAFVALSTHFFPSGEYSTAMFRKVVFRLKLVSIVMVGLSPFVIWWLRVPKEGYFMAVSGIAAGALGWYLVELLDFLRLFLRRIEKQRLAVQALVARTMLLYMVLVPFGTVYLAFFMANIFDGQEILRFVRIWEFAPAAIRVFMFLPPLMALVVLWKSRRYFLVQERIGEIFREKDSEFEEQGQAER